MSKKKKNIWNQFRAVRRKDIALTYDTRTICFRVPFTEVMARVCVCCEIEPAPIARVYKYNLYRRPAPAFACTHFQMNLLRLLSLAGMICERPSTTCNYTCTQRHSHSRLYWCATKTLQKVRMLCANSVIWCWSGPSKWWAKKKNIMNLLMCIYEVSVHNLDRLIATFRNQSRCGVREGRKK